MPSSVDAAEFDSFMAKVELVNSTIRGLSDGTVSIKDTETVLSRVAPPPPAPEQKEQLVSRPGRGVGDDYTHYCSRCCLEFAFTDSTPPSDCPKCQTVLLSRDDRHALLKLKARRLQEEKKARSERRQRFKEIQERRRQRDAAASGSAVVAGSASSVVPLPAAVWDDFEPSSDSDTESLHLHNPQLAALEADMTQREQRRRQASVEANALRLQGNAAFRSRQFDSALSLYTSAIEKRGGDKTLYCNRAACLLRLGRWEEAAKDCTLVLDVWELMDRGEEKRRARAKGGCSARMEGDGVVVKALMRRSEASRQMQRWQQAADDLNRAEEMEGEQGSRLKEIRTLMQELKLQQEETRKEAELQDRTRREADEKRTTSSGTAERSGTAVDRFVSSLRAEQPMDVTKARSARLAMDTDDGARVAFRSGGGLQLIIRRLADARTGSDGEHKAAAWQLESMLALQSALLNDGNKEAFVQQDGLSSLLLPMLQRGAEASSALVSAALSVLVLLCEREAARAALLALPSPFLPQLLPFLSSSSAHRTVAVALLSNLTYSKPWKAEVRANAEQLMPALESVLQQEERRGDSDWPLQLSSACGALSNLFTQAAARSLLAGFPALLPAIATCCTRLCSPSAKQFAAALLRARVLCLALLLNLTTVAADQVKPLFSLLMPALPAMLGVISGTSTSTSSPVLLSRAVSLIARGCTLPEVRDAAVLAGAVQAGLALLEEGMRRGDHLKQRDSVSPQTGQGETEDGSGQDGGAEAAVLLLESAIKMVAACSQHAEAPALISPRITLLCSLLAAPSPLLAGNAAQTVATLSQLPSLHPALACTVPALLAMMRQWGGKGRADQSGAASNAAVACSRMARYGRNLEVIRENGGMQLLAVAGQSALRQGGSS